MQIPAGLTVDRTNAPVDGMIRYNTTLNEYEGNRSVAGQSIASLTNLGTTATLTTSTPHGLSTDDYITVSGVTPTNYNSSYHITVIDNTSFTYTMASDPGASASVLGSYVAHLWDQIGGGATGGGNDKIFVENGQTVTISYTIPSTKNAMSAGPITINSGVVVTVPSGSVWTIV